MNTNIILKNYYTLIDTLISEFLELDDQKMLFKKDFRGQLFAVEGILRLHLKSPLNKLSKNENTTLENILLETKKVEDFLGAYSLLFELEEYANQKMSPEMKSNFNKEIKTEQNHKFLELKDKLKEYQLEAKKHYTTLDKINWPKKEKKFLKKTLNSELKRIDKKICKDLKKLILSKKYDYEALEDGFHEFRRAIRWISIYVQGYKPFFSLSKIPKKLNKKDSKIYNDYKDSPFAQLSMGENLIQIDAMQYYKLSHYINSIGKIKTQGEMNYYLSQRGSELLELYSIEKDAHKSYREFVKEKIFKNFIC